MEKITGDMHYTNRWWRGGVGPKDLYDVIGFLQLSLLVMLGLREKHTLLDIGCGSMRGGRFFIPYLNRGKYTGVEPNQRLVEMGIKYEVGDSLFHTKGAHLRYFDDFKLSVFGSKFDYVVAQSIFSHTPMHQMKKCLVEAYEVMHPQSLFMFTYMPTVPGEPDYTGGEWCGGGGGTARYSRKTIKRVVEDVGFCHKELRWHHPSGQCWVLASKMPYTDQMRPTYSRMVWNNPFRH